MRRQTTRFGALAASLESDRENSDTPKRALGSIGRQELNGGWPLGGCSAILAGLASDWREPGQPAPGCRSHPETLNDPSD
jgi:hypothetical protein